MTDLTWLVTLLVGGASCGEYESVHTCVLCDLSFQRNNWCYIFLKKAIFMPWLKILH